MTLGGPFHVARVEAAKLVAQVKTSLVLAICAAGPFAFAIAMRIQSSLPTDTLFGRAVKESGFAIPLVILGFAGLWALPALTAVVAGDIFSAEDRHGTWTMALTRSRSRSDVFVGKVVAAMAFSTIAVTVLAISSIAAGLSVIGTGALVDLSGLALSQEDALRRVILSWASVLPPSLAFTAVALLISVATRSGAAGIGLPVVIGLVMQLLAFVDGPEPLRRALITSAFGAWRGLLVQPAFQRPLVDAVLASAAYVVVSLAIARRLLLRREIGR